MFDFISYARDMGVSVTNLPPTAGIFASLEVRDLTTGCCERHDITDTEAAACSNIDQYTGTVLDSMTARIGSKKAQLYASRHTAQQMRDREDFFRGK